MPPPSSRRAVVGLAGALTVALFITVAVVVTREPSAQAQTRVDRGIVWRRVDGVALRLDAYLPSGSANAARPAVLLVHGGGWAGGHRAEMGRTGRQLAKAGYAAFSIDYRLAPEHPFPASLVDAQAAVEWLRAPRQMARYGIDPGRIGALGSSAGGQLVGLLATQGTG